MPGIWTTFRVALIILLAAMLAVMVLDYLGVLKSYASIEKGQLERLAAEVQTAAMIQGTSDPSVSKQIEQLATELKLFEKEIDG